VRPEGVLVPDKHATSEDVSIASRLIYAFRAATESTPRQRPAQRDLWTLIATHQSSFAALLEDGDARRLAGYLCNVSRHDGSIGISQGNLEYARITRDKSYRDFLALMCKDKLVSLAEAVGSFPSENAEQGPYGLGLSAPAEALIDGVSERLGSAIEPPDVDGGLFKLRTDRGLFGERDANATFTAALLRQIAADRHSHSVCEIGAGTGRAAYWSYRLGMRTRTLIDLPHVNVVQGYYLEDPA
jgi:hypothetical protein